MLSVLFIPFLLFLAGSFEAISNLSRFNSWSEGVLSQAFRILFSPPTLWVISCSLHDLLFGHLDFVTLHHHFPIFSQNHSIICISRRLVDTSLRTIAGISIWASEYLRVDLLTTIIHSLLNLMSSSYIYTRPC